jgi:hypothetical protein
MIAGQILSIYASPSQFSVGSISDSRPGAVHAQDCEAYMTTSSEQATTTAATNTVSSARNTVFSVLMGISAVAVLLQGLWAGIFLEHDGQRDAGGNWIDVHARGAEVALAFAVLGTAYALWKRRARKDLWIGGLAFIALIIVESYMGGQIRDASKDTLTAIHVPVAMAIMGLAVWLPVRAAHRTS